VESRWIVLEGGAAGPLHYVDFGGDGAPVVLVHGLGGSHVNWIAVGERLARSARVVAVDLAGFGRTPLAGRSSSIEANARLLVSFVSRVLGDGATIVGNSMGGLLAAMVAARAPALVDRAVLVNASLPRTSGVALDREIASLFALYAIPGVGEAFMKARQSRLSPEAQVHETLRVCAAHPDAIPADVLDAHYAMARERRAMAWATPAFLEAARSIVRLVLRPRAFHAILERLTAPTLLIHGTADRLVPVDSARAAARRYGFAIETLEGIGHVPPIECPERFVEIVRDFLEGDAAVRSSTATCHAPSVRNASSLGRAWS
jgi:pimeloyl-ACP methyl ester carboxylesterase